MQAAASRRVGIVLSGSTTRRFDFIVLEDAEDTVVEGKYVAAIAGGGVYLGVVEELSHVHEFYEEGEVWVEALRKGRRPPEGVARRYLRATARIVGYVSGDTLQNPPRPPPPGATVSTVTGAELKPVYGFDPSGDPPDWAIVVGDLYGYTGSERLSAPLDLRAITMHMAVVGTTGSGKSNTMGVIIEELGRKTGVDVGIARLPVTIPALIVDINGDYLDYYCNPDLVPSYWRVYRLVLENSRAYQSRGGTHVKQVLLPLHLDLDILEPHELAEAIVVLYRRGPGEATAIQESVLAEHLDKEYLEERLAITSYNELFSSKKLVGELISDILEKSRGRDAEIHAATARAVERQLNTFYRSLSRNRLVSETPTVGGEFIDELTNPDEPGLAIVDFTIDGAPTGLDVKQFIVYYISKLLYKKFVDYKMGESRSDRVILYVLEEAQNFAPNLPVYQIGFSIARSILYTVATQGRKFGLSLAIVTQRPKYVDPVVLSMMNTFIIHRVPPADVGFVEQVTGGLPGGLKARLSTMEKGVAIIHGQMNPAPLPSVARVRKRDSHGVSEGGLHC